MKYTIPPKETFYRGVLFRSRLEARWAAFFDLCGWNWEYEPVDLPGWSPDFFVEFPCGHSECPAAHTIYAEVKPYRNLKEFDGHASMKWEYGAANCDAEDESEIIYLGVDAAAQLGQSPDISQMILAHGSGGGVFSVRFFVPGDYEDEYADSASRSLWDKAGNIVMWRYAAGGKRVK